MLLSFVSMATHSYDTPVIVCRPGTQATKPPAGRQTGMTSFGYDCDGNMGSRAVGNTPYTLVYDAENRLVRVSGGKTAAFHYDGDDKLVLMDVGGMVTAIAGEHYRTAPASHLAIQKVWLAARRIHLEYPAHLEAARQTIFDR